MQGSIKQPDISSAKSTSDNSGLSWQSCWSAVESHCKESTSSKNSTLKMGVSAQNYQTVKLLNFSFQDQDSGSTQSTGQSYSQGDSNGENYPNPRRMGLVHSDFNVTRGKHAEGESKFTSSMETQNYPQLAVPFPDQYFNGVLSTFGPQAVVMPGRVPLPLDFSTSEPIYVNPKQYRGILRRRQHRAKLEAQNKLLKNRKPYLHESRHQHAVKRARGSGGRFLNKKELQQRNPSLTTAPRNISGPSSGPTHLGGPVLQENNKKGTSSTTHSCSDVTSDDNYHSLEFRFFGYSSWDPPQAVVDEAMFEENCPEESPGAGCS